MSSTPATTGSSAPNASSTALAILQQPYGFVPNAGAPAIRLYPGPFGFSDNAFKYAVATEGASATPVPVTWIISSPAISLAAPPSGIEIPPPNGVEVGGATFGEATLTATTPTQRASVPVYYFPSAFNGCSYRSSRAANFDPSPQPSRDPLTADAYVTGPADSGGFNTCGLAAYETGAGTPYVLHFPYGATLVTDGDVPARPVAAGVTRGPAFEDITPSAYRDDFTTISNTAFDASRLPCGTYMPACTTLAGSIVVFKTAGGRIVKMAVAQVFSDDGTTLTNGSPNFLGVYEVTPNPGDQFPY